MIPYDGGVDIVSLGYMQLSLSLNCSLEAEPGTGLWAHVISRSSAFGREGGQQRGGGEPKQHVV